MLRARIRTYLLPALALIGLLHAVRVVYNGQAAPPLQHALALPDDPGFERFVAGAGIIESRSENIFIASPISGVVSQVHVHVGQKVRRGDPLFTLDQRERTAMLAVNQAAVGAAQASFNDAERKLALYNKIGDRRALSEDQMIERQSAVAIARARLDEAIAQRDATTVELDRMNVRSPIDATVLRVNVRPGEFAPAQLIEAPLMIIGDQDVLHVRVDVDENDAWRVEPGARATAHLRGNPAIKAELEFVRVEPYVVPKRSLTGESSERVDTRVLQVIYRMKSVDLRLYVGQLMDVYIDAGAAQ